MAELKEITICEVCDNDQLVPVLNLGLHPMCDDLIKVEDVRYNKEYPIEILYCNKCYTAHQKYQIPKQDLFPSDYHYRARFTKDVLNGMETLVNDLESDFGSLKGKNVLDIGCNDGSLLDFFKSKGALTFGIDPTDAAKDAFAKGHIVEQNYFSPELAERFIEAFTKPDIITFTNVFAHIEDLNSVLDALKILMHDKTILIIENHYLGAVLERNQFDTFYHEHPRTYSLNSFIYIGRKLGKDLLSAEFPSRYGGNIRIILGDRKTQKGFINPYDIKEVFHNEEHFEDKLVEMNQTIKKWYQNKKVEIYLAIEKYGPIEAKAFPGRAAIPVKMLGLIEEHIKCVYEKPGSLKIGYKVPSTNIHIVEDKEDFSDSECILNLSWHIKDEIEKYLRDKGFKGELINII